ncbi:hypothetical protein CFN78_14290 [Amycolatopsis antarctica]|uniref:Polyketide cyclase n=1 Tax=Amycolatopsis antarctica TaxID=1854586 RepID=A0A263D3I4_9PSEU|nr:SRPBCC family protein [Amycolatopsis antarctica]OZM72779.1 hypothetical protein CFN78_14290 [Amycolatopsis antarctica]
MSEARIGKPDAEGRIEVYAPPERVFALITDLDVLAEVSKDFTGFRWLDGATAVEPGARFRGRNQRGVRTWNTTSTVAELVPGQRFVFDVTAVGSTPVARWEYVLEPLPEGCRVTERTWERRPGWLRFVGGLASGVWHRAAANELCIAVTLRNLKARAEAETAAASASVEVDATADAAFALITDLDRISACAEEWQSGAWLDGGSATVLGSRFRGRNASRELSWETVSTVRESVPGTLFTFDVHDGDIPVSRWNYRIEPSGRGVRVTESVWDRRPEEYKPVSTKTTGVVDRAGANQRNIKATLRRVKAELEKA